MNDDVLVKVDNVSKRFCRSLKRSLWYGLQDLGSEIGGRRHGGGSGLPQSSADVQLRPDEFWALKDVSFELRRGECLGLIGRNGAGKTTLLRMLNGLIKPDTGLIEMRGRVGALIALGAGFNPVLTGRENIYTNASILGMTKSDIDKNINKIIDFAEIDSFIDSPVQSYSSGMQVRLGFAVTTVLSPDIVLLDEVLAVGDIRFRNKCYNTLASLRERGSSFILVTHDMSAVTRVCDRAIYLENGRVRMAGTASSVVIGFENDSALTSICNVDTVMNTRNTSNLSFVELRASGKPSNDWKTLMSGEIIVKLENLEDSSNLTMTYIFSGNTCSGMRLSSSGSRRISYSGVTINHSKDRYFSISSNFVTLPPGEYMLKLGIWRDSFHQIAAIEALPIKVSVGEIPLGESSHIQDLTFSQLG